MNSRCNSRYKGDYYISEEGFRLFLNPYFDGFINTIDFLKCRLDCSSQYLDIEFYIDTEKEDEFSEETKIMSSHFKKLNLNERYKSLIEEDIFPEFYNEFVEEDGETGRDIFIDTSLLEVKKVIEGRIRGLRRYNINHWRKIFWMQLQECDECLSLIVEKRIPID